VTPAGAGFRVGPLPHRHRVAAVDAVAGERPPAQAVDPGYVPAHAGLADAYALMSTYNLGPAMALAPRARAAALRAIELDPRRAEAHASMGLILSAYDWDWAGAEAAFRRAIALDPNYATAHHWYAEFLAFRGRFDEALASSERARRLDPLALSIAADHGAILYFARRHDEAIAQLRRVLDEDPGFPRAQVLAYALVERGRFAEARAAVAAWRERDDSPLLSGLEAYVLGRQGQVAQARQAIARLAAVAPRCGVDPIPMLAVAHAGIGDRDAAIGLLQRACREHSNVAATLGVEPAFDPLRRDPRFDDLLRLVGLDRASPAAR
jgi:tetratricopeptide (TPR) repeat protein